MRAFIETEQINPGCIGPPAVNYGQHNRWPISQRRRYSFHLKNDEFFNKVSECFENFRQGELADIFDEDDKNHFPELMKWRELNYPNLQVLFQKNKRLLEQLIIYLEYDISQVLSDFEDRSWKRLFSVNSISGVEFAEEQIVVSGIAYEINK